MSPTVTEAADICARTEATIRLLVDAGVVIDSSSASVWLSRSSVGIARMAHLLAAPLCPGAVAIGFMEALHVHGVRVSLPNVPSAHLPLGQYAAAAVQAEQTWRTAIDVFTATKSMESVYQARSSDVVTDVSAAKASSPSAVARARRRGL